MSSEIKPEERQMAMFTHLAALFGLVFPLGGNIIGPLVLWLIKKDTMPFVNDQGKEALNFNITVAIFWIVSLILLLIFIGYVMMVVLGVLWFVFIIIAAIKSSEGEAYRYPFTIRFLH